MNNEKKAAAIKSLEYIEHDCVLGVGTGSTVNYLISELHKVKHKIKLITSSSEVSTALLEEQGFTTDDLSSVGTLDLYIDGADEATKNLHLIKGGGGALTREKILAGASRRFICIIDDSKLVALLGSFPVPVEVVPMAQSYVARQLVKAGGKPIWREGFTSDNGNQILDVHNLAVTNPMELETRLNQIPGVVTVGIFANRKADTLLVGQEDGVITME